MHFFKPPSFGAARVSIEFNLQCCQPTDNFINQQFPYIDVINYLLNFLFSSTVCINFFNKQQPIQLKLNG